MSYDPTKHVRVRRSANAATKAIEAAQLDPSQGNMVRIGNPTAITLTNRPANERPFQVMRSAAPATKRVLRTQRNDSPVLALTFPAGYDEASVAEVLTEFNMTGYTVSCDANGIYTALRADLQSIAEIARTDIKLNAEGVIASLDAAQYSITRAESKDNIALVAIEFDAKRFDADAVSAWVAQNHVDSVKDTVENSSGDSLTVKRSEYDEGTELRRVQLDDGVVGVIARSEIADVPAFCCEAVNETAYGNWGWGHLDFASSMADREFCRVMEDASYRLGSVLDNIVLRSQLPLESRKALVDRSLAQYGDFVKNVIDALPRQVMLLVTRAAEPKESNTMKKDEQATAAAPAATADTPVTRGEIATLINEGIAAAFAAQRTEQAPATTTPAATTEATETARSEAAAAPATPAATEAAPATAAAPEATQAITRSDLAAAIAEAQAPLLAELAKVQNTVVLRSDSGDAMVTAHGTQAAPAKRTEAQVFRGAIPGLGLNKK